MTSRKENKKKNQRAMSESPRLATPVQQDPTVARSSGDPASFAEPRTNTERDVAYREGLVRHFETASGTTYDKLWAFSRFVPRQRLTLLLSKYEIMKNILDVQGSIVEIGVHSGAGLFEWAQLLEILEPRNYQRTLHGFDNFEGFSGISKKDDHANKSVHLKPGGLRFQHYEDLKESIEIFNHTRVLGHIPKIALHRGDIMNTVPKFMKDNQQLVVSLLYLDVDLYAPTKLAIEAFWPRMPKGAVVVFDELNVDKFPGETVAVQETLGLGNLRIKRSPFDALISYAVKE